MPYKTLSAYRRAHRKGEDSFDYKKSHNLLKDYEQYGRWKKVLGDKEMPETLAEFQEMKYNNSKKFDELKELKDYVRENPNATSKDYKLVKKLKDNGVKGQIHIPPKRNIDIDKLGFDNKHINEERHHNISKDEAIQFIKKAKMSITRWNGEFERYYSYEGGAYIDMKNKIIRTAFSKREFDAEAKNIIKEIIEWERI